MPFVAVLMGGVSAEREISIQTGTGVLQALESLGYRTTALDFDDRFADALRAARPDVVFNALHGGAGEDGTVQAVLEWLGVPYQGSGVRASAIAMDKWAAKALMRAAGLATPEAIVVRTDARELERPDRLGLPLVVKPRSEGSAVGVSIVRDDEEWQQALSDARRYGADIIAEAYVRGREFTVAVLDREALPVVEIAPSDEFYTYHSKYTPGGSRHTVPADIPPDVARRMQAHALALHDSLGARDYSRVDVMLADADGASYLLECNTLPGLTPLSLFPDAAKAAGIAYEALVDRLVRAALSRSRVGAS